MRLESVARPQKLRFLERVGLVMLVTFGAWGFIYHGLGAISLNLSGNWGLLLMFMTLVLAVLVDRWISVRRSKRILDADIVEDLALGNAETCTVEVRQAVEVQEFEDEGMGFYLETDEGKTLFLQGQYLYDLKGFPSTRIEITRALKSRTVLELKCLGLPMTISSKLPPFSPKDHESGRAHYDGDVINKNIHEIVGSE